VQEGIQTCRSGPPLRFALYVALVGKYTV